MHNFFKDMKIKRELKEFQKFKANYEFSQKEIVKKDDALFCDGICIKENGNSEYLGECEKFVNVGYKLHGALPKVLSNLFPYSFYFKGQKLSSIESFFQAIKFKNVKSQKLILI